MVEVIRAFFWAKGFNLFKVLCLWGLMPLIKYGYPEVYSRSRYSLMVDLIIILGIPAAFLWDWWDFRRKRKN